jgi:hypothetical protein
MEFSLKIVIGFMIALMIALVIGLMIDSQFTGVQSEVASLLEVS